MSSIYYYPVRQLAIALHSSRYKALDTSAKIPEAIAPKVIFITEEDDESSLPKATPLLE